MRIKIAPDDPQSMSQDGDAILRSLQNKSLPMVDLMVRESLQNSLDAALENSERTIVNFYVNHFKSEKLADHLEGVTDELRNRHSGEQKYIAISDSNTSGLTGEYLSNDINVLNNSNFHKLVFGIGKNQSKEGAGGSWGLGKTSYFRMGIGIVIYYTRIKVSNGYEERLIASLIESPKNEKKLLIDSDRGIAWWGTYKDDEENIISPITGEEKITEVLSIFNLERYKESQTGTTIIIPYVGELYQHEGVDNRMPWEYKDEDILDIAVQRWYMPRLFNEKYSKVTGNSMLECKVNKNTIVPGINTQPLFEIFQQLYNAALTKKSGDESITVKDINLGNRAMKDQRLPVGRVAFKEVSRDDLMMGPPHNKKSALEFLGSRDKEMNEQNNYKIMAYSRSPGMVVEYSIDGDWFPKEMVQKEEHLLCAFFVPNSGGGLSDIFKEKGFNNLESYLRSTENADHANWVDEDGFTLVQRAKSYTSRAIMQEYQTGEERANNSATSALSRKFGEILMPPTGFGKTSAQKKKGRKEGPTKSSTGKKPELTIVNSNIKSDSQVLVNVRLNLKSVQKYRLFLQVMTQEQKINVSDWTSTMGEETSLPFAIEKTTVTNIEGQSKIIDYLILEEKPEEIILENAVADNLEIELEMIIRKNSEAFMPGLAIRSMER